MRSILFKILLLSLFLHTINSYNSFCEVFKSETNKVKVFLTQNDKFRSWFTISGDDKLVSISLYLLTTDTKSSLEDGGIWSGVGFGSFEMNETDMIVCFNLKTSYFCSDNIGGTRGITPDKFLNGHEDTLLQSADIQGNLPSDFGVYKSLVTWNLTKNITTSELQDWSDWKNWKTNNGKVMGAVGYMNITTSQPNQEVVHTIGGQYLTDLSGYPSNNTLTCRGSFLRNYIAYTLVFLMFLLL